MVNCKTTYLAPLLTTGYEKLMLNNRQGEYVFFADYFIIEKCVRNISFDKYKHLTKASYRKQNHKPFITVTKHIYKKQTKHYKYPPSYSMYIIAYFIILILTFKKNNDTKTEKQTIT